MDRSKSKRTVKITKRPAVTSRGRVTKPIKNTAGVLVLQWLTYAFWGGFGLSILWISAVVFNFYLIGDTFGNWEEAIAYPLAAVIVLYLISMVTDYAYARHEPDEKHGVATVIMLIYTVLYALAGIVALIVAVFGLIRILIGADSPDAMDGPRVMLYTALTVTAVYGLISARAIFAGRMRGMRKLFWLLMSLVGLTFIVLGVMGPALEANRTKQDRMVEEALPALVSQIQNYTTSHGKLPAALADVEYRKQTSYKSDEVQKMIDQKLVRYTPNTRPATIGSKPMQATEGAAVDLKYSVPPDATDGQKTFYYKICVDYQYEKKSTNTYSERSYDKSQSYTPDTGDHARGEVCYDLRANGAYRY